MTAGDFFFSDGSEELISFVEDEENNLMGRKKFNFRTWKYTVVESDVSNYAKNYNNCTEVSVNSGETITCTITNDDFVHSGGNGGGSSFTGTPCSNTGSVLVLLQKIQPLKIEKEPKKEEGKVLGDSVCTLFKFI